MIDVENINIGDGCSGGRRNGGGKCHRWCIGNGGVNVEVNVKVAVKLLVGLKVFVGVKLLV